MDGAEGLAWIAMIVLALVLLAVGALCYAVALYNGLVQVRHQVDQAWANIDVLLRQRHDELPALIAVVSRYTAHERGLLGDLTDLRARARAAGSDGERLAAEQALSSRVPALLALAQGQPSLRPDASFGALQARIAALEDQIARRRSFYNDAVTLNNLRRESFPDRLFARFAGLVPRPSFRAVTTERVDANPAALRDR